MAHHTTTSYPSSVGISITGDWICSVADRPFPSFVEVWTFESSTGTRQSSCVSLPLPSPLLVFVVPLFVSAPVNLCFSVMKHFSCVDVNSIAMAVLSVFCFKICCKSVLLMYRSCETMLAMNGDRCVRDFKRYQFFAALDPSRPPAMTWDNSVMII